MSRRKTADENTETAAEFSHEQVSRILSHNLDVGLLHLPPDFAAESPADSLSEDETKE